MEGEGDGSVCMLRCFPSGNASNMLVKIYILQIGLINVSCNYVNSVRMGSLLFVNGVQQ